MILIWGYKTYVRLLGLLTFVCGTCHNPAAQRAEEVVKKFTLFWVPLFPFSRKTRVTCTFCGTTIVLSKDDAARLREDVAAQQDGQHRAPAPAPASVEPSPTTSVPAQSQAGWQLPEADKPLPSRRELRAREQYEQ